MTTEKCRDAINDSGGVDAGMMSSDRVSSASCAARVTTRHDAGRWGSGLIASSTHTCPLNSFMTSRKRLYTSGWSTNWIYARMLSAKCAERWLRRSTAA